MKHASRNGAVKGYYGKPIVKVPEWTALIPTYFWTGGFAGTSATLAIAARCRGNVPLARAAINAAAAGSIASGICLIADLKRPARFLNMLRVFKPTSPMSVGVYVFSAFGGASTAAALSELTGVLRPLGIACEAIAGLIGPVMSVYTAVLLGDTVLPAWHGARTTLPLLFATTSASTAGALATLSTPAEYAAPARRLAAAGALGVPFALQRLRRELGERQHQPYTRGKAGLLAHLARALNAAGLACTLLGRRGPLTKTGAIMVLAAGLAERFAVFDAGKQSAEDPSFVIDAQRHAAADPTPA